MLNKTAHGAPVLVDEVGVAELLPNGPWHDDAGVGPSHAHHTGISVFSFWGDTGKTAFRTLGISHIAHPFMEKGTGIGEEGAGLSEHLCVSRPPLTLIALRAVGRYGKIVATHAPKSIGNETVDIIITSSDAACFEVLSDGSDRNRTYLLDAYISCGG